MRKTVNAQTTKSTAAASRLEFHHSFDIWRSSFVIRSIYHSVANRAATVAMKLVFGCVARIQVIGREHANQVGQFVLAANHISHFDPFIISAAIGRKIDWMTMADFFSFPLLGVALKAVDAFPAARERADVATIRTAVDRLSRGSVVGLFPEGGIRDSARSILEGAPLRRGATTLAQLADVPVVPCVILGSDRLYSANNWLRLRRPGVWIAFGQPILPCVNVSKCIARERAQEELAATFRSLYVLIRETFKLTADDLPHSPRERMQT